MFRGKLVALFSSMAIILIAFYQISISDEITKNDIEDLDVIISQFVGGKANVLTILDLSASMRTDFGGVGTGNWDASDIIDTCENFAGGTDTFDKRSFASHCAENVAGTSICGSIECEIGVCDSQEEFDRLLSCVNSNLSDPSLVDSAAIFDAVCQGPSSSDCDVWWERVSAAASLESAAGFTQCATLANCQDTGDPDPGCDTVDDYDNFKSCYELNQLIDSNTTTTCTGGDPNCMGKPQFGSSRLDVAVDMFLEIFDADNSIEGLSCTDPDMLYDGTSSTISCMDYLETPFRDVDAIIAGTTDLPSTPATNPNDELTETDIDLIDLRLRPMKFGGTENSCTDSSAFSVDANGFDTGSSSSAKQDRIRDIWNFYRNSEAIGGTPLALALGFDDDNSDTASTDNPVVNDSLNAFKLELETDPGVECRGQVAVVITDGEDSCSGDCDTTPSSCGGLSTTNANRRSAIQSVSNLRTYYARNPVTNNGQQVKKEIPVFVVGLNIKNEATRRMLHAMALAGGTYAGDTLNGIDGGVIQHTDPNGNLIGSVLADSVIPIGSAFNVFKDIATANDIDTNPSNAVIKNCLDPSQSAGAHCDFTSGGSDASIFDDTFFTSGTPFTSTDRLENFAYLANTPDELLNALKSIFQTAGGTFSGAVGSVPPATSRAASPDLRGRVALTINTPRTTERIWQGRLALYGIVNDPENFGNTIIIRKPDSSTQDLTDPSVIDNLAIFNDNGVLTSAAKQFHWDAGKNLTEISPSERNLLTAEWDTTVIDTSQTSIKRYTGNIIDFDTNISPDAFGISDADTTTIPSFCATPCSTDCVDPSLQSCKDCVKGCIRDKVVDYMRGNNEILPVTDPLGTAAIDIGINCPDPNNPDPSDVFDQCSVKFSNFNSQPIFVGSPPSLFLDTGFALYVQNFRKRSAVMYVGSNAGYLEAFHAGNLVDVNDENTSDDDKINPFTNVEETFDFYSAGEGRELFGFTAPPALIDSTSVSSADTISGITPPDYRTGDFKSFVLENLVQRSFYDSTPLIADVFLDGNENQTNGIPDSECDEDNIEPILPVTENSKPRSSADGKISVCGKEYHTVLFEANKNGGGYLTALDVTNPKCADEACDDTVNGDGTVIPSKLFDDGPEYPSHLWTIFDENFGNTWSTPNIGKVRMKTVDKDGNNITVPRWILFIGGGLDPIDTYPTDGVEHGKTFNAIDIATGRVIYKFNPDNSIPDNISTGSPRVSNMTCDVPGSPGIFDINTDGFVDLAYIGDTCGRMWRFDISMPIDDLGQDVSETGIDGTADIQATAWTGDIVFCAAVDETTCLNTTMSNSERQPVYYPPTLAFDSIGKKHIVFVTGNRRNPSSTNQFGKLYNFIDEFIPAFIAAGNAVTASIKTEADFDEAQIIDIIQQDSLTNQFTINGGGINDPGLFGEFIVRFPNNLDASDTSNIVEDISGEKGIGTPVIINGIIIFTTFAPSVSAGACGGDLGSGRIFALDFQSAASALSRVPGAAGFLAGTASQKLSATGIKFSEGMPSEPRLTAGQGGSLVLTISFTGGPSSGGPSFLIWEMPKLPQQTQLLFWEELT